MAGPMRRKRDRVGCVCVALSAVAASSGRGGVLVNAFVLPAPLTQRPGPSSVPAGGAACAASVSVGNERQRPVPALHVQGMSSGRGGSSSSGGGNRRRTSGARRSSDSDNSEVASSPPSTATASPPDPSSSSSSSELSLGERVRDQFPILSVQAYPGTPLTYLDSAATSQKPQRVIDAMSRYYCEMNSNVHRGAHALAVRATEGYEGARDKVKALVNAEDRRSIVFTRGATEAINLVANTWGEQCIEEGDEIVLSVMEHHSNMVPWQMLAKRKGAVLKFVQLTEDQSLDMDHFHSLLGSRTKLVSLVHASNSLGCINPIKEVCEAAHAVGAKVLVDGCQSVPNMPVDVQALDCDWLVASSHKMCGPTGIGFLYGKLNLLRSMPPWQGGGEMIDEVFFEYSTFNDVPARFEAGTPAIAEAIGLGEACDFLMEIGMDNIAAYEHELSAYLWQEISKVPGLTLLGPPANAEGDNRNPLVAFNSDDVHAHDLSFFMDQDGVAVRGGHHCTQALHRMLGHAGSIRASCYLYNTKADIDTFITVLKETMDFFGDAGMEGVVGGGESDQLLDLFGDSGGMKE